MRFLAILFAFVSIQAIASENAFRFNVGHLASGLSYVKENLDFKGGDTQDTENYHISLAYLRHLGYNIQAVGSLGYEYNNVEAGDTETENNELLLEIGALYNFSSNHKSSFYAGLLYYRSERFQGEYDDAADSESEGSIGGVELTIGKRFNLIENLSYVISIDYITGLTFDGDYSNVYDGGSITRVNLATFEYYF